MKMKKKAIFYLAMLLSVFANAQQSAVVSGGVATGTNGTITFSIGQLIDDSYSSGNYAITLGVQQPYEVSDPLPVQLLSFKAVLQGNQALLTWKTAHEQNSKSFEVEKKPATSNDFSFLASLAAKGNNGDEVYNYRDNSLTEGITYYRLKKVDNNGLSNYSQIVLVNLQSSNSATLKVYPNPALTQMNIAFNAKESKKYNLQLIDALGRTVISKQISCIQGSNTISWNIAELSAGEYILKAVETEITPVKIIKK